VFHSSVLVTNLCAGPVTKPELERLQCLLHNAVEKSVEEHVDLELRFLITLNCMPLRQVNQAKGSGDKSLGRFAICMEVSHAWHPILDAFCMMPSGQIPRLTGGGGSAWGGGAALLTCWWIMSKRNLW